MSKDLVVIDGKTLTRQDIENAIIANGPVLSDAADSLGIARWQLEDILNKDQYLNTVFLNEMECVTDFCIRNVCKGIKGDEKNGVPANINLSLWWMERIGKTRGFSAKAELTLVKSEPDLKDLDEKELEERFLTLAKQIEDDRRAQADLLERSKAAKLPSAATSE